MAIKETELLADLLSEKLSIDATIPAPGFAAASRYKREDGGNFRSGSDLLSEERLVEEARNRVLWGTERGEVLNEQQAARRGAEPVLEQINASNPMITKQSTLQTDTRRHSSNGPKAAQNRRRKTRTPYR